MKKIVLGLIAAAIAAAGAGIFLMRGQREESWRSVEYSIDFLSSSGETIRPLHGINSGPLFGYENGEFRYQASGFFRQAGIPYVRLHDVEYPYGKDLFVDIHCVFPNFEADPDNPASYHFEETDQYIRKAIENGSQVFFR